MTGALLIVTIGLFGAVQMFHVGMDKTRAICESRIAMQSLQNEIETLRAMPFDSLSDGASPFRSQTPGTENLVNAFTEVTIRGTAAGLKEIAARIRWVGDNGRVIEKRLTTLIAEKKYVEQ